MLPEDILAIRRTNKMEVMAFDLGASSGRAIVGVYADGKITLHEIHRFENTPITINDGLHWNFSSLLEELKIALKKSVELGFKISSIGIDSWGVDYGLVANGSLKNDPFHYRDSRGQDGLAKLLLLKDEVSLKIETGMDCAPYNTVNQLLMEEDLNSGMFMLNIPDLFNYFLTGIMASEYSMATTTQLYDYKSMKWNYNLMKNLGINPSIFKDVHPSRTVIGPLLREFTDSCKLDANVSVVSVTSHDTSAAINTIPVNGECLFIATGTWIIIGSKQESATMNKAVLKYGLTNEGGTYPSVNLLKNCVGLWLLQESRRYWQDNDRDITFSEMIEQGKSVDIESFIDIGDSRFYEPGNMPLKVVDYCKETSQAIPTSIGEIVKVIEQSLALGISTVISQIEEALSKSYDSIYIFGGGIQDQLLCDLIEKYTSKKLIIATKEASSLGNVIDQLMAHDVIDDSKRISIL